MANSPVVSVRIGFERKAKLDAIAASNSQTISEALLDVIDRGLEAPELSKSSVEVQPGRTLVSPVREDRWSTVKPEPKKKPAKA